MLDRAIDPAAIRPAAERAGLVDVARPRHRIALSAIAEAARTIDPVFRDAPQVALDRLVLVDETRNPIRCFKGRGTAWFVHQLADRTPLVCASAGNFGLGLAHACRARGIPLTVFAATNASPVKLAGIRALGADVVLEGTGFDAAKDAARRFAGAGRVFVEDGREPAIAEGAGTIAVELLAREPALDAIVVPLGDGALLTGIARWTRAASPSTRIVAACPRGAPAMADSLRRGTPVVHERADTIADGVAVRVPVPEAIDDLRGLVDDILSIDDAALAPAMRALYARTGIVAEPTGVLGLAAAAQLPASRIATIVTGGNLDDRSLLDDPR